MAAFYSSIKGNRGEATRMGSYDSGIKASVQSWNGSVITRLNYVDDKLMVDVEVDDGSASIGQTIFYGTFEEFKNKLKS